MNNFTSNIINCLLNNKNIETAIEELFRVELEKAINELLKFELTAFLQYEKYDRTGFNSGNSRNGYYDRDFDTRYGKLHLVIPRDRNGEFSSPLVPKYERRGQSTEDLVLKLYQTGLTNDEIATIIEALYYQKYSKTTISNITDQVIVNIDKFKSRSLSKQYAVIYLDSTFTSVRRDTVEKEAIHIALGITMDGNKEILGYLIAPNESCVVWDELLKDLQSRGLEKVLLFVTDGLSGIEDTISNNYPQADIQRCLVHVDRNIMSKVRVKDRAEIMEDFKEIYRASNKDKASKILDEFLNKWQVRYPKVYDMLIKNQYLLTFYDYPEAIRSSIYSTNLIEGLNKQLKRKIKRKEQFPNEESLEKFLVTQFEEYNMKFGRRIHKGFGLAIEDLQQLMEQKYQ
ncbi:MAG: IS256 family transposase [Bacilli bacterium]|nr:IS256 family transposase [Bacilli bacterium]